MNEFLRFCFVSLVFVLYWQILFVVIVSCPIVRYAILLMLAALQAPNAYSTNELVTAAVAVAVAVALKLCNVQTFRCSNSNDEAQHGAWCILYLSPHSIHAAQYRLQVSFFFFFSRTIKTGNKDEFVTENEQGKGRIFLP